jgi:hypothetical protein
MSLNQKRPAKKLTKKRINEIVSDLFRRLANGIQIPILDLGKVSRSAETILLSGGSLEEAEASMKDSIETYRVKP